MDDLNSPLKFDKGKSTLVGPFILNSAAFFSMRFDFSCKIILHMMEL